VDETPDDSSVTRVRSVSHASTGGLLVSFVLHSVLLGVLGLVTFLSPPPLQIDTFQASLDEDDAPSLPDDAWLQRPSTFRTGEGTAGGGSKGKVLRGPVTSAAHRPNFDALLALDAPSLLASEGPVNPGAPVSDVLSGLGEGNGMGIGNGNGDGGGNGDGSYFGMKSNPTSIVFIVDASSSMNRPYPGPTKTRFRRVQYELLKTISQMTQEQQFLVIFFSDEAFPMPSRGLVNATAENLQTYMRWIVNARPLGNTDPEKAVVMALKQKPQTIYFLTDGNFSYATVRAAKKNNSNKIPIHTIGFGDNTGEDHMKEIAADSGATYRFIPEEQPSQQAAQAPGAAGQAASTLMP
jgi:hypothetical protein